MEIKLKSISRTIHWSLLLKALIVAILWMFLPYWAFLLLALGFYFIPFFEPRRLFLPFLLFLFFAAVLNHGYPSAFLLGIIFFLILGIKNLLLIDRASAYETLFFALFFLAVFRFFVIFESPASQFFVASTGVALIFALLLKNFLVFSSKFAELADRGKFIAVVLPGIIIWQWLLAVFFLPINHFYQTALVFLAGFILTELMYSYIDNSLDRRKILTYFSVFFAAVAIILAANSWKI